ncbi:hypothetical protein FBQ81_09085 [Chloroflexi bacterium CFX6]|nr:hypothetical protein [Chloroflexi bacterium CFX6]
MTQTINVRLPEPLYSQLKRAAELSRQPADVIIAQSLAHSLPPLLEEIPNQYQPDVFPLLKMNDAELKREMSRVLPPKHGAEYESLLDRKRSGALTSAEEKRLDALRREADVLTFRKGYAAVLLKRRGYRLPPIEELGTSN